MAFFFTSEFLLLILMIGSGAALGMLMRRKMQILRTLPSEENIAYKERIRQIPDHVRRVFLGGSRFSFDLLLQTVLSNIRKIAIRTDKKTSEWLTSLRKRTQERKQQFSESYWKQTKKSRK